MKVWQYERQNHIISFYNINITSWIEQYKDNNEIHIHLDYKRHSTCYYNILAHNLEYSRRVETTNNNSTTHKNPHIDGTPHNLR